MQIPRLFQVFQSIFSIFLIDIFNFRDRGSSIHYKFSERNFENIILRQHGLPPFHQKISTLGTQTIETNERDKWTNKFLNLLSSSDNFGESNFAKANN